MDPTTVSDIAGEDGSVPGMRAVVISEFGGPEQLKLVEDHPQPEPGDGQVLIKVSRAGINFADTHARENSYLASYELPLIPGTEVAGEVDGRRVVALTGTGGYAEYAVAPEQSAFPVPDGVSDNAALGIVVQGLSAWHLLKTSSHLAEGETVVVHAAAGGVGTIAVQLAKRYGAGRVIATASTEEKRALALELGADAAVAPNAEDLNAALREANGGNKVDIVLEMAGGRVFDQSLRALAPFGRLVTYGLASREPNQVSNGALMRRSQAVVGFWLMHCFAQPQEMIAEPLRELFGLAAAGDLRVVEGETYGLSEARRAHEEMQARRTSGKLLLDPSR
jgi:NADPH:quinone reductase